MTIQDNPSQYANRPVILIHLTLDTTSSMALCAPYFITEDTGAYPEIPRVPCPACTKATK